MTRYILVILTVLLSFPTLAFAHWPSPRFSPTYNSLSEHIINDQPKVKWSTYVGIGYNTIPIVDQQGNIYLPLRYKLVALNKQGNIKWTHNINEDALPPVIGADGNLYFGKIGCNPYIYSLDLDGNKRWEYDLRQGKGLCGYNNPTSLGLSPNKETIYVGVKYPLNALMAFNLDGSIKWVKGLGVSMAPQSPPTTFPVDGTVYIGAGGSGDLFAIASDSNQKWKQKMGVSGWTTNANTPVVGPDNNIYATSTGGENVNVLASFSPDGNKRWAYQAQASFMGEPVVYGNRVYVDEEGWNGEKMLSAVDINTGQVIWKWPIPEIRTTSRSPIVDKQGIAYITSGQSLYAITPEGTTKWSFSLGTNLGYMVIGDDDLIYVYQTNGYLTALGKQQTSKTPLIFIPGIAGSEFKVKENTYWIDKPDGHGGKFSHFYPAGEKVWVNEGEIIKPGNDDYFDVLRLKEDGQTSEAELELIKDTIYSGAYQDALNFFISNGYTVGQDLFVFPYDWRKDISLTAPLLNQQIEAIKQKTGHNKVDIVAHSMGGLVARNYITDTARAQNVRKLITLGTPHLGSVKLLKSLMYGDCLIYGIGPLCPSLSPSELNDVIQNMTGAFQLSPSQLYFNFYANQDNLHPYPLRDKDDIDSNGIKGALNYLQIKNFLTNLHYNTALFTPSESFHNLDTLLPNTNGIEVSIIVGSGKGTLGQIVEGYRINLGGIKIPHLDAKNINGDGTVPLLSASISDPHRNLSLAGNAQVYYTKQDHGNLVVSGAALNLVKNILNGVSETPSGVSAEPFKLFGQWFSVHSPVNIHVYDEQGNHTGPTSDGNFETNILGSSYDTLGDSKYVWIPSEGKYTVKFEATDEGSFDFKIRSFADDINNQTILYKDIPLTKTTKAETVYDTTDPDSPVLQIDNDGNGSIDTQTGATSVLSGSANYDQNAPQTTIKLEGTLGNNGWYKSDVMVKLEADDSSGSGILKTEYTVDDGKTVNVYVDPFIISTEGILKLKFRSIDKAGNEEETQEVEVKIDKTAPEARVFENLNTSDLIVEGVDAHQTSVIKEGNKFTKRKDDAIYQITDLAGNTLRLDVRERDRWRGEKFRVYSVQYNDAPPKILENNHFYVTYQWKGNKLIVSQQYFEVKGEVKMHIQYNSNKNQSTIFVKEPRRERVKEIKNGLITLQLLTNKGQLEAKY